MWSCFHFWYRKTLRAAHAFYHHYHNDPIDHDAICCYVYDDECFLGYRGPGAFTSEPVFELLCSG
jgi:hypothetical protein